MDMFVDHGDVTQCDISTARSIINKTWPVENITMRQELNMGTSKDPSLCLECSESS